MRINTTLYEDDIKTMVKADLEGRLKVQVPASAITIRIIRSDHASEDYMVVNIDVDTSSR